MILTWHLWFLIIIYVIIFEKNIMFKINSDIIRSSYIWGRLKEIIEKKWLTITEVAENMWITQPALSRVLNWKVWWSDNFFIKAWNAIWILGKDMKEIFMEADKEEFKYKHWTWLETLILEDLKWKPETTVEELEESLFQLSGVDNPTEEDKMTLRFALDMARKRAEEDKQKRNKK